MPQSKQDTEMADMIGRFREDQLRIAEEISREHARSITKARRAPPFHTEKNVTFYAQDSGGTWYVAHRGGYWENCPSPK